MKPLQRMKFVGKKKQNQSCIFKVNRKMSTTGETLFIIEVTERSYGMDMASYNEIEDF